MIAVPTATRYGDYRLLADSADATLFYVDILDPAPAHGRHILRWLLIPEKMGYLVGEVRFGPNADDYARLGTAAPAGRVLPIPFESVLVYVWNPHQRLAEGRTSSTGMSNAVLNATVPVNAVGLPAVVAAELTYRATLLDASFDISVDVRALDSATDDLALGADADWSMTLADVLIPWLRAQHAAGTVHLTVRSAKGAAEELETIALVELARRIAAAQDSPACKLALPASGITRLVIENATNLSTKWGGNDINRLSVVRSIRCDDIPIQTP